MAQELDRRLMPRFLQSAFTVSLGMAYKSMDAMKHPRRSTDKVLSEVKELFQIPDDAGSGLGNKVKAVAAVWMEKGATWTEQCRSEGNKFTRDDETA